MIDPTELALRNAIRAAPAGTLARLVYADWLDEQSDPARAELATYIRLECEWLSLPHGDARFLEILPEMVAHCERTGRSFGGWEFADELTRIRQKADELRTADTILATFGSARHGHLLTPPLSESDLLRFEAKIGGPLPAEYRAFLLHIGNGPMGPNYGLTRFDLGRDPEPLRRTFPFPERERRFQESPRYDAYHPFPPDDQDGDGWLHLCEHGCGWFQLLVLNGHAGGWLLIGGNRELHVGRTEAGEPFTFLPWYETWLDNSLQPDELARARNRQVNRPR